MQYFFPFRPTPPTFQLNRQLEYYIKTVFVLVNVYYTRIFFTYFADKMPDLK